MNNIVTILVGNMDAIKALKSKYIMITPECIYGTDEDFIILRSCPLLYGLEKVNYELVFNMDQLNYLYKNCDYIKDIQMVTNNINISFINSADNLLLVNNYMMIPLFIDKISKLSIPIYSEVECVDLTNDTEFNILQDYKTSDGIYMYNYNGYIMALYNNIIPRNKSDKIYLTIKDEGSTFIACFTVEKKKIGRINTHIKYIKLS